MTATLKLHETLIVAAIAKLKAGMAARVATINAEKADGITLTVPGSDDFYYGGVGEIPRAPAVVVTVGDDQFDKEGPHSLLAVMQLLVYVIDEDPDRQRLARRLHRQTRAVIETLWDDAPQEALTGSAYTLRLVGGKAGPVEAPEPDGRSPWRAGRLVVFAATQAEN